MNENTKKLLKDFKNGKNLQSILKSIIELCPKEIVIFLKAGDCFDNRNIRQQSEFWRSQLPFLHFKLLIKSDLKEQMLCSIFSNKRFINGQFLKVLSDSEPQLFIKYSKLSKSFLGDDYMHLYEQILKQHANIKLRNLFCEYNFLYNTNKAWNDKESVLINSIKHCSVEDILIQASAFLEIYKRDVYNHDRNYSGLISFSHNLKLSLNRVLSKKQITQSEAKYTTVSEFRKYYDAQFLPEKPIGEIVHKNEVIRVLDFIIRDKITFEYSLDNYAVGFVNFESIDNDESELSQNQEFIKHRRNVKKYTYTDYFFSNKGISDVEPDRKYYNINRPLAYWDYLELPYRHSLKHTDDSVCLKKVLLLLYTLSSWMMPAERQQTGFITEKVKAPIAFQKLFSREYISVFNYKDLCQKICKYFAWSISEVASVLNYLSTDLLNKYQNEKVDCYASPFFRIGNNIYWLTNLYEDLKWECNLHERIVKEKLNHNIQTAKIEKSLTKDFINAQFDSVPSHKYKFQKGGGVISGEIDNLAYKDGYLFVVEMKTTYVEENPGHKAMYHSQKVEGKAKYQLEIACEYIKKNFDEIQSIKELNIDRALSDIKIIPLIVSNIFDYDGEKTENGIMKISDFTLRLILNNDLADLMFSNSKVSVQYLPPNTNHFDLPIMSFEVMSNKNNPDFKPYGYSFPLNRDQCSLWSSEKECSPEDLLCAIKQNKVWNFIDKVWDFKPSSIIITKP